MNDMETDQHFPQVESPVDNMRVLSVRQPWSGAMFCDGPAEKTIENRSWWTKFRGVIAIHASQKVDPAGMEFLNMHGHIPAHDRGVVLGTVELLEVHEARSSDCNLIGCLGDPWAEFPDDGHRIFHWEIGHPREFVTPIPASGRLGLWEAGSVLNHLISIADVVTGLS